MPTRTDVQTDVHQSEIFGQWNKPIYRYKYRENEQPSDT